MKNVYYEINNKEDEKHKIKEIEHLLKEIGITKYNPIRKKLPSKLLVVEDIDTKKKRYIIMSSFKPNGRNTYLMQGFFHSFKYIINEEKPVDKKSFFDVFKKIKIYLFDNENKKIYNNYQILIYRTLKTLGCKIVNSLKNIAEFNDIDDWILYRERNKRRNTANNSSYLIEDNKYYVFLTRTDGANFAEAMIFSFLFGYLIMKNFENKKLKIIPMEKKKVSLSNFNNLKKIFDILNIIFENKIISIKEKEKIQRTARKQAKFKDNLYKKYKEKKCYFCSLEIPELLIASHIYRISDIDKNPLLTEEEKEYLATSADNGIWLCRNHDILFENGIVVINEKGEILIKKEFHKKYSNFIKTFKVFKLKKEHLNKNMINNIKKYLDHHNFDEKNYISITNIINN